MPQTHFDWNQMYVVHGPKKRKNEMKEEDGKREEENDIYREREEKRKIIDIMIICMTQERARDGYVYI